MSAPIGAILCGVLSPSTTLAPITLLDVATDIDTNPSLNIPVGANDPVQGAISGPVITEGPAGASVSVVNNELAFNHNGAGIYVIAYTSTIGALSDTGFATVVITPPIGGGVPPTFGTSFKLEENANVSSDTITIPANSFSQNTRVVLLGLGPWKEFGSEVETITSLPVVYDGNAMTRIDTHDNLFRIGNDGGGPDAIGPAAYVFALVSTPTFSIPTDGDISWTFNLTGGLPELQLAGVVSWDHPTRHLVVSELGNARAQAVLASSVIPAAASNNSGLSAFSSHKRQVNPVSQAGWTQRQLAVVNNAQDIQSGRFLVETREISTGGNFDYTIDSDQNNLHGGTVVQVQDPAGGVSPPTAQNLTVNATSGGPQISIDMSTTGGVPKAVNLKSGGGTLAPPSGNNVLFTPPATDGISEIEASVANAGGAVISTITVTSSSVSLGPRVGFGAGLGQTETSLGAINTAAQAALGNFEAELRSLHDARLNNETDATIMAKAENAGFVTLTGKSLGDLNTALGNGNRKLFLTAAGGDYNWSGNKPDFDDIELVGLVDAGMPEVVIGGTPKNRGQIQFPIRGQGGRVEGIEFKDGALCFSFVGSSGIIPRMHMDFCKFTNVANSIHMEFGGSFGNVNSNTGCQSIRWNNCLAENVSHGLNMRCGPGYGETGSPPSSPDFQVGAFEAIESMVKDHDNMGICCHYDTRGGTSGPGGSVFWPGIGSNSVGLVRRCIVDRRTIGSLNGFPCNLTACEDSRMEESFFMNTLTNQFGRDDDVYTKSRIGHVIDCVIWNTGTSTNFQGQLGCKGEGNAGSIPLGLYNIQNNFIGHDNSKDISRNFFVQRSNVRVDGNVVITADGSNNEGGGITQQGGGDGYDGFTSLNNLYRCFGGFNQSAVAQLSANISNWTFTDDVIETFRPGSHTLIQLRNGGNQDHLDTILRRVRFIKRSGAGNVTAITIQKSGSGQLRNPTIDDCDFEGGINTAIAISGGTVNGAVTFTNNQHAGTAPNTSNSTGSTVNTFGGGGGNSF